MGVWQGGVRHGENEREREGERERQRDIKWGDIERECVLYFKARRGIF
jgi:hypothetical protein